MALQAENPILSLNLPRNRKYKLSISKCLLLSFRLFSTPRGKYRTHGYLRTSKNIKLVFTSVSILWVGANTWFRSFLMPAQMLIIRSVQFCNFLVIRYRNEISILDFPLIIGFSALFGGSWLGIVAMAGLTNTFSGQVLRSFRNLRGNSGFEKKSWNRERKSFKPLILNVGQFYVMNTKTVLNVASSYVWGTARLLILFPHELI